jgi:D-arabinose 1-dehydrogenase-like Zn-dependent alcohol dehydrogenase
VGNRPPGDLRRATTSTGTITRSGGSVHKRRELTGTGKIAPTVERTYPLSEAAEAIRHLQVEHVRARIVVTV